MSNPYDIDTSVIAIRRLGATRGHEVFVAETEGLSGLAVCNFRREVADFVFDEFEGDYHIGHDEQFAKNLGGNFVIAIRNRMDVARLRGAFIVV